MLNNKILKLINSIEITYYSIDSGTYKGVDRCDENIYIYILS